MILGTRGSRLALWQAEYVKGLLLAAGVGNCELQIIRTQGDRIQDVTFDKLEGKGFFTSELEKALLSSTVDIAVHSLKDLPTEEPEGLTVAAIPVRANSLDLLLIRPSAHDPEQPLCLAPGSVVGTSSNRRRFQLLARQCDLRVEPLRGNVPTRLRRLVEGRFDAIVLAAAGLERLGLDAEARREGMVLRELRLDEMVPAAAQGALGIQCRSGDKTTRAILERLHHPATAEAVAVERGLLAALGGGCQIPLGAHCRIDRRTGRKELWAAWAPSKEGQEGDPKIPGAGVVRSFVAGGEDLVARAAATLHWKAGRRGDLEGVSVWIGTSFDQRTESLAERLRRRGAKVRVRPLIRQRMLDCGEELARVCRADEDFEVCLFTSKMAVRCFREHLNDVERRMGDCPALSGARVLAMGRASAAAIRGDLGVHGILEASPGESSGDLARRLLRDGGVSGPGRALVLRARGGRTEFQETLRDAGWRVEEVDLYETVSVPLTEPEIALLTPDTLVLVGSPSAARSLVEAMDGRLPAILSIGPTTTEAVREAGGEVVLQAFVASLEGMEEALGWRPVA